MREIIIKYDGQCKKCNTSLLVGQQAMYEKSMGCFCIGCEPKDTEEIRHYRQIKADVKADRLNGWAKKREVKAQAQLNSYPEIRQDIAFNTQPGHIPFRARMNRSDDKAFESLNKAKEMRDRADSLSHVKVKGDAEKRHQAERDANDERFKVGDVVKSWIVGTCTILKINKKTYTVKVASSNRSIIQDKSFITNL